VLSATARILRGGVTATTVGAKFCKYGDGDCSIGVSEQQVEDDGRGGWGKILVSAGCAVALAGGLAYAEYRYRKFSVHALTKQEEEFSATIVETREDEGEILLIEETPLEVDNPETAMVLWEPAPKRYRQRNGRLRCRKRSVYRVVAAYVQSEVGCMSDNPANRLVVSKLARDYMKGECKMNNFDIANALPMCIELALLPPNTAVTAAKLRSSRRVEELHDATKDWSQWTSRWKWALGHTSTRSRTSVA